MPRQARVVVLGRPHHIVQRCHIDEKAYGQLDRPSMFLALGSNEELRIKGSMNISDDARKGLDLSLLLSGETSLLAISDLNAIKARLRNNKYID